MRSGRRALSSSTRAQARSSAAAVSAERKVAQASPRRAAALGPGGRGRRGAASVSALERAWGADDTLVRATEFLNLSRVRPREMRGEAIARRRGALGVAQASGERAAHGGGGARLLRTACARTCASLLLRRWSLSPLAQAYATLRPAGRYSARRIRGSRTQASRSSQPRDFRAQGAAAGGHVERLASQQRLQAIGRVPPVPPNDIASVGGGARRPSRSPRGKSRTMFFGQAVEAGGAQVCIEPLPSILCSSPLSVFRAWSHVPRNRAGPQAPCPAAAVARVLHARNRSPRFRFPSFFVV